MLPIRIYGIKRIIKIAHSNWNPGVSVAVYSVGPIPGSEVLENLSPKMLNFDVYRKKFFELFRGVSLLLLLNHVTVSHLRGAYLSSLNILFNTRMIRPTATLTLPSLSRSILLCTHKLRGVGSVAKNKQDQWSPV